MPLAVTDIGALSYCQCDGWMQLWKSFTKLNCDQDSRSVGSKCLTHQHCLLGSVTQLRQYYSWATQQSLLNSENPWIFQLVLVQWPQSLKPPGPLVWQPLEILKLIGASLPLGLKRSPFTIHLCLCTSMHNAHRRYAIALGTTKPGGPSHNQPQPAKTCQNWFLYCFHVLSVTCPFYGLKSHFFAGELQKAS